MRILYLITRADMGGAQIHLLDLIHGLKSIDPIVGVGETGYLTESLTHLKVPYVVLPNLVHPISPWNDARALFETTRLIRAAAPDLVHAHTSKAGVIGRLAARAAGVPSIFTAHTWCFAEGTSLKWRVFGIPAERLAGRCGAAIINVSEANRTLALECGIARPDRLHTVWNGMKDVKERATPDAPEVPTIAMVARCVPQKNHLLLMEAFAEARRPGRIVFAGDGPLEPELRQAAKRLQIDGHVTFLGRRTDVSSILAGAHIFALATNWEGFPLSILEGMRAGLPVIASNVGGIAEAVRPGKTGFLVEKGDTSDFARRLVQLLDDPSIRKTMGQAGRQDFETRFTLKTMLEKTMAIYRHVAAGSRRPEASLEPVVHGPVHLHRSS